MVRQAYVQFILALCLFPLFVLPTRILIQITYFLSVWAIVVTSQAFISAAEARKDTEEIEEENDKD